jgi:hypothetical protein
MYYGINGAVQMYYNTLELIIYSLRLKYWSKLQNHMTLNDDLTKYTPYDQAVECTSSSAPLALPLNVNVEEILRKNIHRNA